MKRKTNIPKVLTVLSIGCICLIFFSCGKKKNDFEKDKIIHCSKGEIHKSFIISKTDQINGLDINKVNSNLIESSDLEYYINPFNELSVYSQAIGKVKFKCIQKKAMSLYMSDNYEKLSYLTKKLLKNKRLTTKQKNIIEWFLGLALTKEKKYDEAEKYLNDLISYRTSLKSGTPDADTRALDAIDILSRVALKQGDINKALQYAKVGYEISQETKLSPYAYESTILHYVECLINAKKFEDAIKIINKVKLVDNGNEDWLQQLKIAANNKKVLWNNFDSKEKEIDKLNEVEKEQIREQIKEQLPNMTNKEAEEAKNLLQKL